MTSEQEIQLSVVAWLDLALPSGSLRHHSPNESLSRPQYRKKQKKLGLRAGWPDIEIFCLPTWFKEGKPWSPIFIELKSAKGRVSPHQKEVLALLEEAGCHVAVCRSLDEVREFLSEIIQLKCA